MKKAFLHGLTLFATVHVVLILLDTSAVAADAPAPPTVTVAFTNAPLAEALKQVGEASELQITFTTEFVEGAEAVTLTAKDEPIDAVLGKMLRPRGLEFIRVDDASVAVIRFGTDLTMAKLLGRSVRTLAHYAMTLDEARQTENGDVVIGWSDDDVRAAADALVDFLGAVDYFESHYMRSVPRSAIDVVIPSREAVLRAASLADADVRAGIGAAFGIRSRSPFRPERLSDARVREAARLLLADDDPIVRACWLSSVLSYCALLGPDRSEVIETACATGAKDSAPEVRLAATLAPSFTLRENKCDVLAPLLKDRVAAVRLAAWLAWIRGHEHRQWPGEGLPFVDAFNDLNPIVRSIAYVAACLAWRRADEYVDGKWVKTIPVLDEAMGHVNLDADPVLRQTVELFRPLCYDRDDVPTETLAALAESQSLWHHALAAEVWAIGVCGLNRRALSEKGVDMLAPLSQSKEPHARLFGLAAAAPAGNYVAQQESAAFLKSAGRLERLAVLHGAGRSRTRYGALPAILNSYRDALVDRLRAPDYAEATLACKAISQSFSFDDQLALLQKEIEHDPSSLASRLLLSNIVIYIGSEYQDEKLVSDRQTKVAEAVLAAADPSLDATLFLRRQWQGWTNIRTQGRRSPMPAALAVLAKGPSFVRGRPGERMRSFSASLVRMFKSEEPADRRTAFEAAVELIYDEGYLLDLDARAAAFALVRDGAMAAFAEDEKPGEGLSIWGFELLHGLPTPPYYRRREITWNEVKTYLRDPVIAALGKAADADCRPYVAVLLGDLYPYLGSDDIQQDAELRDTIDVARVVLMETCAAEHKAALLAGASLSSDETVASEALGELEALIRGRTLPPEARDKTILAMRDAVPRSSPEFRRYLLGLIGSGEGPSSFRKELVEIIGKCPDTFDRLVETVAAATNRYGPDHRVLEGFGALFRERVPTSTGAEQDAGVARIAKLGRAIAVNREYDSIARGAGVTLCLRTRLPLSQEVVLAALRDETIDLAVRIDIAKQTVRSSIPFRFSDWLLAGFDDLPHEIQKELIDLAYSYGTEQQKQDACLRALKDDSLLRSVSYRMRKLEPPYGDELTAALRERSDDPVLKNDVKILLDKLEKANEAK